MYDVRINMQMHKYIYGEAVRDEEDGGFDWTKRSLGREEYLARVHKEGSISDDSQKTEEGKTSEETQT